jgi:hypothetical protein
VLVYGFSWRCSKGLIGCPHIGQPGSRYAAVVCLVVGCIHVTRRVLLCRLFGLPHMHQRLCLAMQKKELGPGSGDATKICASVEPGSRDAQPGCRGPGSFGHAAYKWTCICSSRISVAGFFAAAAAGGRAVLVSRFSSLRVFLSAIRCIRRLSSIRA